MKAEDWIATLAALAPDTVAPALRKGRGAIVPTGWSNDDGQDIVTLRIEVPVHLFRTLESGLEETEDRLGEIANKSSRSLDQRITRVVVTPQLLSGDPDPEPTSIPSQTLDRIWTPAGMLRLFISHVSAHKSEANDLKTLLAGYGIAAFVAHEDIEPTAEWEDVIESALRSMDAMLLLLTDTFHESRWTDQEVGFAMGLNRPLVPVRAPVTPYGFMGRFQAMSADLSDAASLARRIFDVLIGRSETREAMIDGLIVALEQAGSFRSATLVSRLLEAHAPFVGERAERILAAIDSNNQVAGAWNVPERLRRIAAVSG